MAITHNTTAAPQDVIASANWNAEHDVTPFVSITSSSFILSNGVDTDLTIQHGVTSGIIFTNGFADLTFDDIGEAFINLTHGTDVQIGSPTNLQTTKFYGTGEFTTSLTVGTDVGVGGTLVANYVQGTFQSSDTSTGITQTETGVTNFDITIKDGIVVGFTKN